MIMTLGIPQDITCYKLLTDLGSVIAGFLALVAAVTAYLAGVLQAKATREAAKQQVAAIERQRNEEVANIRDAVRVEVTAFTKDIIGALEVCEHIKTTPNTIVAPYGISHNQAQLITKILKSSVVYPAIADRVGLLSHSHATVEFYERIAEANGMLEALRTKAGTPAITRNNVAVFADSLITALQLARCIISSEDEPSAKRQLGSLVQAKMVRQIDSCLKSAKAVFPNAESFSDLQGG
jgi:hypothetical protein